MAAFNIGFPIFDGAAGYSWYLNSSSITNDVLTYTVTRRQNGAGATIYTSSVILSPCTPDVEQWSLQSIEVIAVLCFAFFLGFRTGFRP